MNWTAAAVREASNSGNYGQVVKLARIDARLSQAQLGDACGLSQSAVSRLEGRGVATYDMSLLARAATHLKIPMRMVGLADQSAVAAAQVGTDVERRSFVKGAAAVAVAPVLSPALAAQPAQAGDAQTAPLRLATTAFRRLDGSTPSRQLQEAVLAHLRLAQTIAGEAEDRAVKLRLAAVGSEAASLAGWLAWDMGDYGSARTWYGNAVKAARSSDDRLLTAYQMGSLAQFEANTGNVVQSLNLLHQARRQLPGDRPLAIADAWLLSAEALAHAVAGDARSSDRALTQAARAAELVAHEDPAPWPWLFTFNGAKVAAARISCGARLGLPQWVQAAQDEAGEALSSGHAKQRALLQLDLAQARLASGRVDGAFALATRALETGVRYRSGRIVERARAVRRSHTSSTPPKVVRDFDERLHGVYL